MTDVNYPEKSIVSEMPSDFLRERDGVVRDRFYLETGAKRQNHMQHLACLDAGDFDGALVTQVLTAPKKTLLSDSDALALLELLLDCANRHVWLDIELVLPA